MSKKLIVKNKYTVIPNSIIQDNRISSKALGMFCYIQNKPEDWEFSAKNIAYHKKEGIDLVRSALIELETYGYLQRVKSQDEKGFWSVDYILNDKPTSTNPTQENPISGEPESGNSTNNSKKNKRKPKISKEDINIPFDVFYNAYGKKVDRDKAELKWNKLTDEERCLAMEDTPKYIRSLNDRQFQKNPATYIHNKSWKDERVELNNHNPTIKTKIHV